MTTRAYSQRHLISVAELASAIAIARGTTGVDELRELARQAEDGNLAALPLYPPHQLWRHGGDVNRIGAPTENPAVIWRMLAAKVSKPHLSDKDGFNYPPAASTWHMLAADVYGLGMTGALNRRASAALRELAVRYSPELGDDDAELLKSVTDPAEPDVPPAPQPVPVLQTEAVLVAAQAVPAEIDNGCPAKISATVNRGWVMKKAALIKKHAHQWLTIKRDFQDASENGLSRAAKAPGHGDWFEAAALDWARQRWKLTEEAGQSAPSPATPFSGLTHRIQR